MQSFGISESVGLRVGAVVDAERGNFVAGGVSGLWRLAYQYGFDKYWRLGCFKNVFQITAVAVDGDGAAFQQFKRCATRLCGGLC